MIKKKRKKKCPREETRNSRTDEKRKKLTYSAI